MEGYGERAFGVEWPDMGIELERRTSPTGPWRSTRVGIEPVSAGEVSVSQGIWGKVALPER
jgi:hypothetical protein